MRRVAVALVVSSLCTSPLIEAQTRDDIIRNAFTAYDDFDSPRALQLLRSGLNASAGAQDSIWASGVHLLAQILVEEGQASLADTWLRWAVRLAPEMNVDSINFLSDVVAAMRRAQQFVGGGTAGDDVTQTSWLWSVPGAGVSTGRLRILTTDQPLTVLVEGTGLLQPGSTIDLAPGSYTVEVSAEGFVTARITREVLPGATTSLSFSLLSAEAVAEAQPLPDSVLPPPVETAALSNLARLTVRRFGMEASCAASFLAGRDGVLLTTYEAIRGAEAVEVELFDGRRFTQGIGVAAHNPSENVAVLKVPTTSSDSLMLATQIQDGQYGWTLGFPNCGAAQAARLRIARWTDRPRGLLELGETPTGGEPGGPLIDQQGRVVGIGTGRTDAVPATRASQLLSEALRNIQAQRLLAVGEVARQEQHIYGSVAISSAVAGAIAQVTGLESWHWPELARTGLLPFTYTGPMGRYALELREGGQVRETTRFTIRPGVLERLTVTPAPLPAPQIAVPAEGGGFPWPIALLGVAGAGAAVAVLAGGGGGDGGDGGGNGTTGGGAGGIVIRIPNP